MSVNFHNSEHLVYIAEIRMSRQKFAATQALEISQDLSSDCSDNEYSDSKIEELINSTVARVGQF